MPVFQLLEGLGRAARVGTAVGGEVVASGTLASFWRWWVAELRDVVPGRQMLARAAPRRLVLAKAGDVVRAQIEERGRVTMATAWPPRGVAIRDLTEALQRLPTALRRLPVSVRVETRDCHQRTVELPAAAARDFDRLLAVDLERATPLRGADVMAGYIVEGSGSTKGMMRVRHVLVKKRTVEPLLSQIRAAGLEPASLECCSDEVAGAQPVDLLRSHETKPEARGWTLARMIGATAGVMALGLGGAYWARQEAMLHSLSAEVARLETGAREGRNAIGQAQALSAELSRVQKLLDARAAAARILEEVTRLVPDTAWLEELHIDSDAVEIAGLATSASTLLATFERSAMFHETRFTAPLRLEAGLDRERFRLRARLRSAVPEAGR